jgi:hypothetical protein
MQTSLIQAFDEHGTGLVLRGHDFEWDPDKGGKSPHLNSEQACDLVRMVLTRYHKEMHQVPSQVVIHKRSRFWPGSVPSSV